MKVDKKYAPYLFATIMAVAMGALMSFCFTAINTGINTGFLFRWLKSFGVGFVVAFPTSLLIAPVAQKIVTRLTSGK